MLNFDNAATTKISKQSLDAFVSASEMFFNPSSLYAPATEAKKLIENCRSYLLRYLKGKPNSTLIFTGCASESNNAVLNAHITRKDKKYLIGGGEHSSIYTTAKHFKDLGYDVQFIPLLKNGAIDIQSMKEMLDEKVTFVSVIYVSNETGAVNDIKKICKIVKDYNKNIIVHTDAVQALGKVDLNATALNVDYITLSAHKINGPKGVGALYIANPNKFKSFILGGEQEFGLRAGTENLPGIMAFKVAVENLRHIDYSMHKKQFLDNLFGDYILVSDDNCVDNIISVCFKGVRGETIEHMLETKGYLIGTGSACNSKAGLNRVLSEIVPKDYIEGAVRISFDNEASPNDLKNLAIELSNAVEEYKKRIQR